MFEQTVDIERIEQIVNLFGNFDENIKRIEKKIQDLEKQQAEISTFEEKLRHYADQRISLDLDDGVRVNYGKFGDLLANVKDIRGVK